MRKRNIKSVAHWVIMSIVLLFPILMVGISSFSQKQQEIFVTETYEYETNEVNSVDDLVVGNIYKFKQETNDIRMKSNKVFNIKQSEDFEIDYLCVNYDEDNNYIYIVNGYIVLYVDGSAYQSYYAADYSNAYFIYQKFVLYPNNIADYIEKSDYLGEKTIDYNITDQTMRDDVNEWCASFRNLPVNQWYGDLLNTIGLGITSSMMMNVIYTYPLYVLWVYILDLVVDIFLVIINLGHNALQRLGGNNE